MNSCIDDLLELLKQLHMTLDMVVMLEHMMVQHIRCISGAAAGATGIQGERDETVEILDD